MPPERKNKPIPPPESFGGFVYAARIRAGLQLLDAGRLAGFRDGCYLSMIEGGSRVPLLRHVPRLALAVQTSPVELSWLWIKEFARPVWNVFHGLAPGPDVPAGDPKLLDKVVE